MRRRKRPRNPLFPTIFVVFGALVFLVLVIREPPLQKKSVHKTTAPSVKSAAVSPKRAVEMSRESLSKESITKEGVVLPSLPQRVTESVARKAKIAIVLDDWGYNERQVPLVKQINRPLTIAVLPNLAYSSRISEVLHNEGCEIILHLPLEPHNPVHLEKNTIVSTMSEDTIRTIVNEALESVVHAKGVSNHMGSKSTQESSLMGVILQELKHRRLYFLDSYVTSSSVCSEVAERLQLPFAQRDVFLDNKMDRDYIKRQIDVLKEQARVSGVAIGIGHDRRMTLEVLQEVIPQLEKEGYAFVFVSDLVRDK